MYRIHTKNFHRQLNPILLPVPFFPKQERKILSMALILKNNIMMRTIMMIQIMMKNQTKIPPTRQQGTKMYLHADVQSCRILITTWSMHIPDFVKWLRLRSLSVLPLLSAHSQHFCKLNFFTNQILFLFIELENCVNIILIINNISCTQSCYSVAHQLPIWYISKHPIPLLLNEFAVYWSKYFVKTQEIAFQWLWISKFSKGMPQTHMRISHLWRSPVYKLQAEESGRFKIPSWPWPSPAGKHGPTRHIILLL